MTNIRNSCKSNHKWLIVACSHKQSGYILANFYSWTLQNSSCDGEEGKVYWLSISFSYVTTIALKGVMKGLVSTHILCLMQRMYGYN
jgi:hypothetical protein